MSYAAIQSSIKAYAKRVYGPDIEVDNAIPLSGGWQFYARYPGGRWFKVKVPHSKLQQKTANDRGRRRKNAYPRLFARKYHRRHLRKKYRR